MLRGNRLTADPGKIYALGGSGKGGPLERGLPGCLGAESQTSSGVIVRIESNIFGRQIAGIEANGARAVADFEFDQGFAVVPDGG